ncbi:MAG: prolyl oligopeptidase family serine peptidase [Xanthomonadaceae bacterium]|nr:prolyl oligopeptidase family serine peptidase [Xanthomonadaceae bacterium]
MRRLTLIAVLLFCNSSLAASTIQHEFISHPNDSAKKVEYYWTKPEKAGRWPAIIYIHGHQEPERPGGKDYVDWGVLKDASEHGYVAVAVSQPGYGESSGPPDFCGPFTQQAIQSVIDLFRKKDFVKPDKIGIPGVSRGAIVASMIITQDQKKAAAALLSGSYDLHDSFNKLIRARKTDSIAKSIAENIYNEISQTETIKSTDVLTTQAIKALTRRAISQESFSMRSTLSHAEKIKTPLLILNGAKDNRTFPYQAKKLSKSVSDKGIYAKVMIYPNFGHFIQVQERSKETIPFFTKHLK